MQLVVSEDERQPLLRVYPHCDEVSEGWEIRKTPIQTAMTQVPDMQRLYDTVRGIRQHIYRWASSCDKSVHVVEDVTLEQARRHLDVQWVVR